TRAVARDRSETIHRRPRLRARAAHAQLRPATRHQPPRPRATDGGTARPRARARQALAIRTLCPGVAPRPHDARARPPAGAITSQSEDARLWRQGLLDG